MLNSVKLDTMNQRNSTLEEQYLLKKETFIIMKNNPHLNNKHGK